MLLRSFGEFWNEDSALGVVIYETPVSDNIGKARSSVKDCFEIINSDLDKASLLLASKEFNNCKANKLAAKAIKARVKLYQNDFESAKHLPKKFLQKVKRFL